MHISKKERKKKEREKELFRNKRASELFIGLKQTLGTLARNKTCVRTVLWP